MSPVGTIETCRPALMMSVHRGRPEVAGSGSKRRFCVASGFAELAVSGLASMYPAFDWSIAPGHHGYQRACIQFPFSGAFCSRHKKIVAHVIYNVRMREIAEVADGGRASEQIALHLIAKFVLQELKLGVGLDAFGQHGKAEPAT